MVQELFEDLKKSVNDRWKEMFDFLVNSIKENRDLFKDAKNYLKKEKTVSAHKIVELKPGIFGISLDLKETFNFFNQMRNK